MKPALTSKSPASFSDVAWRGECCIDSVSERLDELVNLIGAGRPIRLDATAVTRIDTAGIQLLVAFALEAGRRGLHFEWVGASDAVMQAARLANLADVLQLPHA